MNIYDIARLAGVSIATVSRVVNNSPKVSERTKEKVRAVMEAENYTPNVFARGLGINSMKTIGIICPDVSDDYMAKAVACLEKGLRKYGYDCILYCSGYTYERRAQAVNSLLKKKIDALILVGSNYVGNQKACDVEYLIHAAKEIPLILINGYVDCEGIYCMLADNFTAVYDAVNRLIKAGKKEILFLYDSDSYSAKEKMRGYENAMKDCGILPRENLKVFVQNKVEKVREALNEKKNLKFDAVVATDDGLAIGAMKYVREHGKRIPEEISVVGYNDLELAVCCEPELTSIDSRSEDLCNQAVEKLMKILEGEETEQKEILSCRLKERSTTKF